jgi:hypothetical protein
MNVLLDDRRRLCRGCRLRRFLESRRTWFATRHKTPRLRRGGSALELKIVVRFFIFRLTSIFDSWLREERLL